MTYVTDTHPLLWYLAEDPRLATAARAAFDDAAIAASSNYRILPLDLAVVLALSKLTSLSELHDRIIVASANLLNVPVIARDSAIAASGYVATVW